MATGTNITSSTDVVSRSDFMCSLCQDVYKEPKILDCMHSFCEKCLKKYVGKRRGTAQISCPDCRQEMRLPRQGIRGLTTNHLLIAKVAASPKEKVTKAHSEGEEKVMCEIYDVETGARHCCLDHMQLICDNCQKVHSRIAAISNHPITTMEDIRQEKEGLAKRDDGSLCPDHNGKKKKFYCETCEEFICQDCTTEDHCKPQHNYTDSVTALIKCKQVLKNLLPDVAEYIEQLERSLAATSPAKQEIENTATLAIKDVRDRADTLRREIANQENNLMNQIRAACSDLFKNLSTDGETATVELQRAKLSLETATELQNTATDSQMLLLFPTVSKRLRSLGNQKPPEAQADRILQRYSLRFKPSPEDESACINLGKLHVGVVWEQCAEFKDLNLSKFASARGVVAPQPGEIAVTILDYDDQRRYISKVMVLSTAGEHTYVCKRTIQLSLCLGALGIAAAKNLLVVADGTNYVKMYDINNELVTGRFCTAQTWSEYLSVQIQRVLVNVPDYRFNFAVPVSVAIKKCGTIIVGDIKRKLWTEHSPSDCSVIKTIHLEIEPCYLAVDAKDRCVVSDAEKGVVMVYDEGKASFTIEPSIMGEKVKYCKGVCCDGSGIYVAVHNVDKGTGHIHQYDETGGFVSCIVKGLYWPNGITFTTDGQQLAVADSVSVKMFHKV
ncbi:uncharacterized protein LOC110983856 isoform X2 [Acanthaster planci]|nr:uncharacterized protein LOC110983856 isoform X2 [Acanthaster planci]XP_022099161.1 uncharacterized protein LOC110983856 isoform X2 [Acanthaster planci]XP_022099162.1 uncharacterized protein LOC110983856 isoform X2 [Acanthaster planci]XP_022099164.1 uncharacterized protein LOC110983856 isoform X2 [Acanthaster planci]XP_022099165.1 uncharacterized protein LOC110983856 isoform X2 [Acanthaster planci]